jgi:hypothetical protein
MSEFKTSKQFFSISNEDATNSTNINSMQLNFNNSALTDIQSANNVTSSCVFTPVNMTLDWDYTNISEELKNNKLSIKVGANADQVVIVTDGSYNAQSLTAWLNVNMNTGGLYPVTNGANALTWLTEYDPLANRIAIAYTTAGAPANVATAIDTYPVIATVQYDMTRMLGKNKSEPKIEQTAAKTVVGATGRFTSPVYNPNGCDFKVFDVLRIHSNIAKRFYELKGETGRKVLSNHSVLFELIVPNITMGSSLVFENVNSDIYSQDVINNFDNLTIEIKDKAGRLIPFKSYCNFSMTFIMTRTIAQQTVNDRIKNIQNFNMLSSI